MADVMTGVPSIVMGLFVYTVWVLRFGTQTGFAGALALACLMLPIVIRSTEEMLRLVPDALREASLALGASRSRTIADRRAARRVPGITSGALLAVARAAGETAPLLFTIGITHDGQLEPFEGANVALSQLIFSNATAALRRRPGAGLGGGAHADQPWSLRAHDRRPCDHRHRFANAMTTREVSDMTENDLASTDTEAPIVATATSERSHPAGRSPPTSSTRASNTPIVLDVSDVDVYYGTFRAVRDVTMPIRQNRITALIGPSGCGKSTVLRCFNRMNDLIDGARVERPHPYHGLDLYGPKIDPVEVRRRIGMVFQKPNPFPKSIYDNVAFGPGSSGERPAPTLEDVVESSLRKAALWDEVKDRLKASALGLSGGQQQRLCIARAIACDPEVMLMDEPCSALDPIATGRIEDLMQEIKSEYTIVIVTHNMQQAARVSDRTAFFTVEVDRRAGHPHRRARRVRRHPADLLQPLRRADGELRHRPLRLSEADLDVATVRRAKPTRTAWPTSACRSRSWGPRSTATSSACGPVLADRRRGGWPRRRWPPTTTSTPPTCRSPSAATT